MKRLSRVLCVTAAACAAALLIWLGGLVWFVDGYRWAVADRTTPTDAIVVLTGGSLRLESGLDLLDSGKGRKLFVSGVNQEVDLDALLRVSGHREDRGSCCIELGHDADDTIGNARETAQWMRRQGYHSLRLVTGWYHMRRSLLEFARALPGTVIVAHPVFPERVKQDHWWAWRGTTLLMVGEYDKYLAALARPLVERLRPAIFREPEAETRATRRE